MVRCLGVPFGLLSPSCFLTLALALALTLALALALCFSIRLSQPAVIGMTPDPAIKYKTSGYLIEQKAPMGALRQIAEDASQSLTDPMHHADHVSSVYGKIASGSDRAGNAMNVLLGFPMDNSAIAA